MFYVVGGVHGDFSFDFVQDKAEYYGPFESRADALATWKAKVWLNVDNALHRLYVVDDEGYEDFLYFGTSPN